MFFQVQIDVRCPMDRYVGAFSGFRNDRTHSFKRIGNSFNRVSTFIISGICY